MIRFRNILTATGLCAGLLFAVSSAAAPKQADIDAYRALIKQDARLATAGYRLAAANAPFCKIKERNPGWVIHDIAQYPNAEIADAAFGFKKNPILVAAAVKGGPADKALIQPNDGFVGMDGSILNWAAFPIEKRADDRMVSFKQLLGEKFTERPMLPMRFSRAGTDFNTTLSPPLVCASDFQIDTAKGIDAGADGNMVSISIALAEYAKEDNDLAAVVAHEMAHNILQHAAKLKSAKVKRGLAGQFGKSAGKVRATETEADQLAIWLLGNAGYDTQAAINFFQKLGSRPRGVFNMDRTHLPWKDRITIMQQEQLRYNNAPKTGGKAMPPLLAN
jgi:beta-barrel assembly-enhancing protease